MGKVKLGIGVGAAVLVVTGWLVMSHLVSWGVSSVVAH
jgi:hypothetical protein